MRAPLIGMPFPSFLVLLILSALAAAIVHWGFRYRLCDTWDGYLGQGIVAWIGAWLGPAVLGHWFVMVGDVYVLPAFLGGLAGAFAGTLNARIVTGVMGPRSTR